MVITMNDMQITIQKNIKAQQFGFAGKKDEWLTPPKIIKSLGEFDLDPCTPINRPWDTARKHFTIQDNGLAHTWNGRVWMNPPFGKNIFEWVSRLAQHGNGIALIPARTETNGFHTHVWSKAHGVFFFKGRQAFYNVDGTVANGSFGAPCCLVCYGLDNVISVKNSGIQGVMVVTI